jgi:hypothetical protein
MTTNRPVICGVRLRLTRLAAAALVLRAVLTAQQAAAAAYYVNDAFVTNDVYCTAAGADRNSGLGPSTPVASLETILMRRTLTSEDTVYIDAGTYTSAGNITIGSQHGGSWERNLLIKGVRGRTVLRHPTGGSGTCCIGNYAQHIEFSGLTFTGADIGLFVDASACTRASINNNIFCNNSSAGLMVETFFSTQSGQFLISHNLSYGNRDGMLLDSLSSTNTMGNVFNVLNNTIVVTGGTAIITGESVASWELRNNILVAKGGRCFGITTRYNTLASDRNDLWTPEGGTLGTVIYRGVTNELATLAEWQRFTQKQFYYASDARSFSRDPAFASPANADYHLKSFGGRWQPDAANPTGGVWVTDVDLHSPCIDAADPDSFPDLLPLEPQPNGGLLNMGCHGGTPEASTTASGRFLLALAPDRGQSPQQTQPICWNAAGQGWSAGDTLRIEYSLDTVSWSGVTDGVPYNVPSSVIEWARPQSAFNAPSGCWVRVSSAQDAAVSDAAFLENADEPPHSVFYVNDSSRADDVWCAAAGDYSHDGLSSNTPLDSIASVISLYNPTRGSTIYVDAGTYLLYEDLLLPDTGAGGGPSNAWFRLIGANRRTLFERQYAGAGSCCIRVQQDFARIEGVVCRGAENGILIDPASCRNASLVGNTLADNSGYGIRVLTDTSGDGSDHYEIRNNLLYNNGGGLDLQAAAGYHRAYFNVENNTIVVFNGIGVACGGLQRGTTLNNNIVMAKGSGYCLSVDVPDALGASACNDLFPYGGACVARWITNNSYRIAAKLPAWQSESALDASSISRDPLFVSSSKDDYHLRSTGGSWHNGAWTADTATSPCIDAGSTASEFNCEPAPNGGRVNLGAYGNTGEASKSVPNRLIALLSPRGGELWSGVVTVTWSASGNGWQSDDTVRVECSTDGSAWTALAGADALGRTGSFAWPVPNPATATASYYLRVVCNQDPAASATTAGAGLVTRVAAAYYVNDAATLNDLFCTAAGASANSGDAPSRPLDSLSDLLDRVRLGPGDTVYVDTGTYLLTSNLVVDATHKGSPDAPVRVVGTYGGSVFSRSAGGANRACLELRADFIRIEGLTCRSADTGISVDASSARHVYLVGNTCQSNSAFGIEVKPSGTLPGEEYQILQNVILNNGAGLFLQGSTNTLNGRCLFVVENNTVFNGGTGIKLLNAKLGNNKSILKNNIVETTNAAAACLVFLPGSPHYSDFNNLRARSDGSVGAWQTGATSQTPFATLTQWRAASGLDKNSLSADSRFVSPSDGNLRLKSDSPCVDAGVISFWMFDAADADGNPRIAGQTADIGAFELYVRASVRLFLQGPFITGTPQMSGALGLNGALPFKSPYADDPRTVSSIPSNVTDWVLVQFRLATNGPAVLSRSLFLRTDGWLVNDAGSPNLEVGLPPGHAYFTVVKHRNHLTAMSAAPLPIANQSLACDFTASFTAFFGGSNACAAVSGPNGATAWALRTGDADGDGFVLPVDEAIRASQTNTAIAYRRADVNLDGMLLSSDSDRIQQNLYAASPVPQPETVLQPVLRISPSRKTLANGESVLLTGEVGTDTATAGAGTGLLSALPLNWAFAHNGSGATLAAASDDRQALHTAGTLTGHTDVVEAWNSEDSLGRAYLNVIGTQTVAAAGQALVIAGRTSSSDTLWPITDYLADSAYTTLRYRGFSKENLHYLSPDPSQDVDGNGLLDDIDGAATFAEASHAFTNAVAGADHLFVYLVDHGGNSSGNGYFRLSGSETLTATQLDAWLDALQDAHNTRVTVLLDFCYAGSFLHALTYTGAATRIVVAACDTNQPSYFVAGGLVSFSSAFFSGVMLGYDVRQCFDMAQSAMSAYQAALLDDDKDGLYTTNDWGRAAGTYIGPTFAASGDTPLIGEVCGNQVLSDETAATLWIGSVASAHPISRAWCLIVPPGHDPDPDNPVTDLPQLDLAYDATSGRYSVTYDGFTAPGTYNVSFYVKDDDGNVSAPRSSYIAQIGYDDRVILVAGGDTNGAAWPAIESLTRLTYAALRLRLFTPDHIRVLAPNTDLDLDGDGSNDVAAASSPASLQAALTEWARTNATDRLTLYMLGEGLQNTLRLSQTESLTTNALALWVHAFQALNPVPVNIVLDFSGAGAFLPALADPQLAAAAPSATRVAIASARAGREALFSNNGTVSFTQYLLTGLISGKTLGDAYTDARRAIRRVSGDVRQRAQLDDNLNGVANEKDADGSLADETYLGSSFVTGADAPVIGSVIPPSVFGGPGTSVTLWAGEVAGMYPVSNVWCVVTPPGFSGPGDLPVLALAWNAVSARYENSYSDLVLPGAYALTFYAQDVCGELSAPAQSEIILSDAYEPDNSVADASLYHGSPQLHTFHTAAEADWVRVFLVSNFIYEIETCHFSTDLDTVIDLYRELPDGSQVLLDHVDEEGSDLGEYTGLDFPESGWYWARITPFSSATNSLGSYEFSVDIPAADGLSTLVVLGIDDVFASALPTGATVTVEGQGAKPFNGAKSAVYAGLTNGTYLVSVPTPADFMPREDPSTPHQVQSLTNLFYANPRRVAVSNGWRMAGFEMLSTLAVTSGVIRDAWTHAFLGDAQIAFTATSGSLTGAVADGSVLLTSYRTNWLSATDGHLPLDIVLGACNWDLSVSLAGYQTRTRPNAVSNVQAGVRLDLGTTYLVPADANSNAVADAWEALHFPSGMNPAADSDGDGLDNRSEYLCGTDPADAQSVLRILAMEAGADRANLLWSAAGGRSYHVLSVTSLLNLASVMTNGPWEAGHAQTSMAWSDTNAPLQNTLFYRIRLHPPQ